MPCDSVVTIGVNLNLANKDLLLKALEKIGARYIQVEAGIIGWYQGSDSYYLEKGKLYGQRNVQAVADKLKVAYTREAVSMAAKRAGWTMEVKSENKLALQKRY